VREWRTSGRLRSCSLNSEASKALLDAGLQPNTISTYVGRSETFLRWLVGDYSPRGPNAPGPLSEATTPNSRSRGEEVLADFRNSLSVNALRRYLQDYAAVTGDDVALREFQSTTGPSIDLRNRDHALALLHWLRRWGCRHLRKEDAEFSANAIQGWWEGWGSQLPAEEEQLDIGTGRSQSIRDAYRTLARSVAAHRTYADRQVDVRLGDTAAAKTMFALRPAIFPPWDEPIRLAFGASAFSEDSYGSFLELAADALQGAARRLEVEVGSLPDLLGRPSSTPAKLVDEYLWMRITRNVGPSLLGNEQQVSG
jgi:hypothetical protein